MSRRRWPAASLVVAAGCVAACSGGGDRTSGTAETEQPTSDPTSDRALSGGEGTVFDETATAFSLALRTLPAEDRRAFAVGNNFFNDNWVTAPASTAGRDGLGPTFNAQSCSSCHFQDGRAQPPTPEDPTELGLLVRLSVPGPA